MMTPWSALSLVLAMGAVPGLAFGFRWLSRPGGDIASLFVQLGMFALCALMLWIVRAKEGRSWRSLGLAPPRVGETVLLTTGALAALFAMLAALYFGANALGLPFGQSDAAMPPKWLLLTLVVRAGIVEEVTYRAVAIDRMAELTNSRTLGWLLPMLIFGVLHYPQGLAVMLYATLAGGLMSALFLWKRNLWANMSAHFLLDFLMNFVLG